MLLVFCADDTPHGMNQSRQQLLDDISLGITEAKLDSLKPGDKLLIQHQFLIIRTS